MNLFDVISWLVQFVWLNPQLVIVLIIGGGIILWVWRRAGTRAERGGVSFWAMLFRWVFFLLGGLELALLLLLLARGSFWVTQGVFNLLAAASSDAQALILPPLTPAAQTPIPIFSTIVPGVPTLPPQIGMTNTPEPTLPPAPATTFYRQFDNAPVEVQLAPGVTELTLYDWKNGTQRSVSGGPFYACAITQSGWLVACPSSDMVVFSPNEVDVATAGITLPPPPTAQATATAITSPTPNQTETVSLCDTQFRVWLSGDMTGVAGTDLVPAGITAELKGPGLVALLPGDQEWTITVLGLPTQPTLTVKGRLIESIPNRDSNGTVQFVGTGTQCQ